MQPAEETLDDVLDKQDAVVTRTQARRYLSKAALEWLLGDGARWQRIHPGVYGAFTGTATQQQRMRAALLYAGEGAFLTGPSGCLLHGLFKAKTLGHVHVATQRRLADTSDVRFYRTGRTHGTVELRGLRTGNMARCVIDATRRLKRFDDACAVIAESIHRGKLRVPELAAELAAGPRGGSKLTRQALGATSAGARSGAEARQATVLRRSSVLPQLHFNCSLTGPDGFIAKPDAYAEESGVAQEIDSVEYHFEPAPWKATMARRSRMVSVGVRMLEVPPSRLSADTAGVLKEFESAHAIGAQNGPPPGVWVVCRDDCPLRSRPRIARPLPGTGPPTAA